MEDWERNPKNYLTDAQGNYILKKDGTPQKRRGRPKNTELSDVKAALHAQKALKKKNSKVKKLRRNLRKEEEKLAKTSKVLTSNVITDFPTLAIIGSSDKKYSPGIILILTYRIMNSY